MNVHNCKKKCCQFMVDIHFKFKPHNHNINKGGIILYDCKKNTILFVQSCNNLWGFPKGSLLPNEDYITGALRELKEETGIELTLKEKSQLSEPYIIKKTNYYYMLPYKQCNVNIQYNKHNDDANGIGWFNLFCIQELVYSNKIKINYNTRKLLEIIFHINVAYISNIKQNFKHSFKNRYRYR